MYKYKFLQQYEDMIEKYATDVQDENRLYDLLNEIDDKLITLEYELEKLEEASRPTLNYEQMNAEFVYQNCISMNDYRR